MVEFIMRPYFLQPYKILPYITSKKQLWPADISREYYLSFEDALWDLLPRLGYKKGSKFLVPSFYCVDVIDNMRSHGYSVQSYEVNKDLTIDEEAVLKKIRSENPDIFIDFEAVGIPSKIGQKIERKLPFNTLIIQDKVHTLMNSSVENYPATNRHLILSSTRKVSPFPGSMAIYSRSARRSLHKLPKLYTVKALGLWIYYVTILKYSVLLRSKKIAKFAEKILKKHDDLIGDSLNSAPLPKIFITLHDFIDGTYVESVKRQQFELYDEKLSPFFTMSSRIWTIPSVAEYSGKLRGYPLILAKEIADVFINECREHGLLIVCQLDNCDWSKQQKLIILPLGPHLTTKDIEKIGKIAFKALTRAVQYDTITA